MHNLSKMITALLLLALPGSLEAGESATYRNASKYKWVLTVLPDKDTRRTQPESGRIKISNGGATTILGAGDKVTATSFDLLPNTSYQVEYTHDLKTFYHLFRLSCADPKHQVKALYYSTCCTFMDAMDGIFGTKPPTRLLYEGRDKGEGGGTLDRWSPATICCANYPDDGGFSIFTPDDTGAITNLDTEIINNTSYDWALAGTSGITESGSVWALGDNWYSSKINGTELVVKAGQIRRFRFGIDAYSGEPRIDQDGKSEHVFFDALDQI